MDQDHMIKQLDQMNLSVVQILVEQAKTSTSVEQILKEMVGQASTVKEHGTALAAHEVKISKLEGAIKILVWGAGIIGAAVATLLARFILALMGVV
jgi:threonine dehydrogenase-like Zn-dependent dehydrogenase